MLYRVSHGASGVTATDVGTPALASGVSVERLWGWPRSKAATVGSIPIWMTQDPQTTGVKESSGACQWTRITWVRAGLGWNRFRG